MPLFHSGMSLLSSATTGCASSTGVFVDAILGCCGGDFCGFFGLGCTTGTGLVISGRDDNDDLLGGGGGCLTTGDVTATLSGMSTDCGNESGGFSSFLYIDFRLTPALGFNFLLAISAIKTFIPPPWGLVGLVELSDTSAGFSLALANSANRPPHCGGLCTGGFEVDGPLNEGTPGGGGGAGTPGRGGGTGIPGGGGGGGTPERGGGAGIPGGGGGTGTLGGGGAGTPEKFWGGDGTPGGRGGGGTPGRVEGGGGGVGTPGGRPVENTPGSVGGTGILEAEGTAGGGGGAGIPKGIAAGGGGGVGTAKGTPTEGGGAGSSDNGS